MVLNIKCHVVTINKNKYIYQYPELLSKFEIVNFQLQLETQPLLLFVMLGWRVQLWLATCYVHNVSSELNQSGNTIGLNHWEKKLHNYSAQFTKIEAHSI